MGDSATFEGKLDDESSMNRIGPGSDVSHGSSDRFTARYKGPPRGVTMRVKS